MDGWVGGGAFSSGGAEVRLSAKTWQDSESDLEDTFSLSWEKCSFLVYQKIS